MSALAPEQIIMWFRDRAVWYNSMADKLEAEYNPRSHQNGNGTLPLPGMQEVPTRRGGMQQIGPDEIIAVLREKKGRPGDLAAHFGVSNDRINLAITASAGQVIRGKGGWLSLATDTRPLPEIQ